MNRLKHRWIWVVVIALAISLLTVLAAPRSDRVQQGSTYGRGPGGYGAWYAYMQAQQYPIQRWQRPLEDLQPRFAPPVKQVLYSSAQAQAQAKLSPITLVQIGGGWRRGFLEDWVKQGNVLVLVGHKTPVSRAPFRSRVDSPDGAVRIETRRRQPQTGGAWLADQFGLIAWEQQLEQGRVISVVAPDFAANAYQNEPGNLKFLARLVTEPGYPIYIDEYLHGYKDQNEPGAESEASLLAYLAKTPLLLLGIQAVVLLALLLWGQNQRLGRPKPLPEPRLDHSTAYIQALAGVLQKAEHREFVVQTLGKAEQFRIQRALGLGTAPDRQTLLDAWVQQTGRPASELQALLDPLDADFNNGPNASPSSPNPNAKKAPKLSQAELKRWLEQVQSLRRQVE
jgi:hypothetical protein